MSHKRKPAEFMKHADIRAGKLPGWPGRPETNGDPFDPNNMDRCDAHGVINEGTILIGATSVNAGRQVSKRKVGIIVFGITLFAYGFASLAGLDKQVKDLLMPSSEVSAYPEEGKVLSELIAGFYVKSPLAKDYELEKLKKFGWSPTPTQAVRRVVLSNNDIVEFNNLSADQKADKASGFASFCERNSLEINDCMIRNAEKFGAIVAAYLHSVGEDVNNYLPGVNIEKQSPSEEKLAEFLVQFNANVPKTASNYCDSENRLFAESWPLKEAQEQSAQMSITSWVQDKKIPENATVVSSMKELINHRIDGDAECKNLHMTALKVNSGALKYLVSVKGRHSQDGVHKIFTKLYFLANLNGMHKPVYVACANCDGIAGLDKGIKGGIVAGLGKSAEGVIEAFSDSDMKLAGE